MQKHPFHLVATALLLPVLLGTGCGTVKEQATVQTTIETTQVPTPSTQPEPATEPKPQAATTEAVVSYKDGEYTATGEYTAPSGKEQITITLTLKEGIVTAASAESNPENPITTKWQTTFKENFAVLVIGKNIADLSLTNVSGSSLTPKGFNDAVAKIKDAARV